MARALRSCGLVQPLPRLQDAQHAANPAVLARRATCTQVEPHRIVAIGGGTGLPAVLEGLCGSLSDEEAAHRDSISAIVTMTDNGGSSGRLRESFGVLPPGDVRNCLAAAAGVIPPLAG